MKGPAFPAAFNVPPPGSCALSVNGDQFFGVRFVISAFICWYTAGAPVCPAVVSVTAPFFTTAESTDKLSSIDLPSGFEPTGRGAFGAWFRTTVRCGLSTSSLVTCICCPLHAASSTRLSTSPETPSAASTNPAASGSICFISRWPENGVADASCWLIGPAVPVTLTVPSPGRCADAVNGNELVNPKSFTSSPTCSYTRLATLRPPPVPGCVPTVIRPFSTTTCPTVRLGNVFFVSSSCVRAPPPIDE